ncbi:MAG TPA: hypothetical protein VM345_12925 [Acidimicrobiales bacterium]|jgi:hypothetical protein|nr:hypothetical protein [Acidimicrobiales bacterium]
MGDDRTHMTDETIEAQRRDEQATASAGKMPTPDEERAAEQNSVDPAVAAAEKEATERGARQQGEGRIEG